MSHPWIADRTRLFDSSGIRKVFDLAAKMTNPINLSIGQPDFDVPAGSPAGGDRGDPEPQERLRPDAGHARAAREAASPASMPSTATPIASVFVTSGTSGGLVLAMLALVNPGDEVIIFDPYFVMYESLVRAGGRRAGGDRHVSRFSHRSRSRARARSRRARS